MPAGEDLLGRKSGQTGMVVGSVVPLEIVGAPGSGVLGVGEFHRIIRLAFLGFELRFAERIVVADAGAAMTGGDAELADQVQKAMGDHR